MTNYEVPRGGFEWTCPYCGTSRLNRRANGSETEHAITALRNHVRSSDDTEHGPKNGTPEGFSEASLSEFVVRVDEDEDPR